jgi:uncharacterized protein YbaR (Trm112 family)
MANFKMDDLVCPVCKHPLTLNAAEDKLKCGHCRRAYPIRDEVPILLEEEALIEE